MADYIKIINYFRFENSFRWIWRLDGPDGLEYPDVLLCPCPSGDEIVLATVDEIDGPDIFLNPWAASRENKIASNDSSFS